MKYSLGISNFLEEISSLSHSVAFLYFFALIPEEGFLISPFREIRTLQRDKNSWSSAFGCLCLSFSPLPFASLLFSAICKASSDSYCAFLHFFFYHGLTCLGDWRAQCRVYVCVAVCEPHSRKETLPSQLVLGKQRGLGFQNLDAQSTTLPSSCVSLSQFLGFSGSHWSLSTVTSYTLAPSQRWIW